MARSVSRSPSGARHRSKYRARSDSRDRSKEAYKSRSKKSKDSKRRYVLVSILILCKVNGS